MQHKITAAANLLLEESQFRLFVNIEFRIGVMLMITRWKLKKVECKSNEINEIKFGVGIFIGKRN